MDKKYIFLSMAAFLTASCESGSVEYKYPQKIKGKYEMVTAQEAEQRNDTFFDKKYLTFDLSKKTEGKKEAWRRRSTGLSRGRPATGAGTR